MKHGLVMEGGAMRGLFTAGVIDVMMEQNIVFDGAVGVSAGAVFGCNYKSHQIGRVLRYNLAFCQDPRYCSMRSRIKTGDLFGADFCYRQIPDELDVFDREAYANSPMDFYVVGTDVRSGRAVYHNCLTGDHEDLDWLRASASMPLEFIQAQGYAKNVVILTQPLDYVKKKNKLMPLMNLVYRQYPNLLGTMAKRHEVYNEATAYIREQEALGNVFVIRPEAPLDIHRVEHDKEKIQAVYDLGRATAEERLDALRAFLQDDTTQPAGADPTTAAKSAESAD